MKWVTFVVVPNDSRFLLLVVGLKKGTVYSTVSKYLHSDTFAVASVSWKLSSKYDTKLMISSLNVRVFLNHIILSFL